MNKEYQNAVSILEAYLSAPERKPGTMDIDRALGAMAAVNCCPVDPGVMDLGALIFNDDFAEEPQWLRNEEVGSSFVGCLVGVGESLADQSFNLLDTYNINELLTAPPEKFRRWCDGYLCGYQLCEESWQESLIFLESENIEDIRADFESFLAILATFADWQYALDHNADTERLGQGVPMLAKALNDSILSFSGIASVLAANLARSEAEFTPYIREEPKVGRNDPCPCGSGKKYKKCCLQ